ncbi:MAG: ArgE/DapE family deacylase [Gammaproteobacteria bacterium]|jgi:acetylornithine deacetylase
MVRRSQLVDPDRITERLVSLIRIPSVTGQEDQAINQIANWLQELDVEIDYWNDGITALQRDPHYPGHEVERAWCPVVVGVVRGERPGPTVMLTGHVDVVPPGDYERWDHEPFSGERREDRVFGCGAADMKSGLTAALEAFQAFADGPRNFGGRVVLVAVPAEEDSGLGTLAAIRRGWNADAAILPEPTAYNGKPQLVIAHAGAMSLVIEVPGLAAHASKRLQGQNALDHFISIMQAMREDERRTNEAEDHPLMRALQLPYATNVGLIEGGKWSSSVMDSLRLTVRIGISLNETVDQAEKRFRGAVMDAIKDDPWLSKNPPKITRLAAGFGSAYIPEDHPLVGAISDAAEEVFHESVSITGAPYGCDMAGWIRLAGVPTVLYGPGDVDCAHAPNEWASLETTFQSSRVLVRTAERILGLEADELRNLNKRLFPESARVRPRSRKR